jgi:hypothetical protein
MRGAGRVCYQPGTEKPAKRACQPVSPDQREELPPVAAAVHRPRHFIAGGDSARPELLAAAAVDARLSTGQAPTTAGCSSPRILRVSGSTAPASGARRRRQDRLSQIPTAPGVAARRYICSRQLSP